MIASEVADFYFFLNREEERLLNEFSSRLDLLYAHRKFDTIDLLDIIELQSRIEYFYYLRDRLEILLRLLSDF